MAIEVCPENAMGSPSGNTNSGSGMSPRISFSHNFIKIDGVHGNTIPIEPYIPSSSLLDSAAEFDFCVRKSICSDQASPSADELFSNGVILPSIQISKQSTLPPPVADDSDSEAVSFPLFSSSSSWPLAPPAPTAAEEELKEDIKSVRAMVVGMNVESNHEKDEEEKLQQSSGSSSKSFWGFKRSRSLHCGSIYKRGLSRVPLLLRSKSTSSTSSTNTSKRTLISSNKGDGHQHKENHLKSPSSSSSSVSGFKFSQPYSSSTMACKNNNQHQKPPLKKNYYQGSLRGGKTNNGVLVNPILNVPSANVLGFSSLFSFGKHKTKSKK